MMEPYTLTTALRSSNRSAATTEPVRPAARIAARDPAVSVAAVVCTPAIPTFQVQDLQDNLRIDVNEFKQIHRIGVTDAMYHDRQKMTKVGPGSYNPSSHLTTLQSPRWSISQHSPRLGMIRKTADQQDADEDLTRKLNLRALHTLFSTSARRAADEQVSGLKDKDAAGESPHTPLADNNPNYPRWMRPTKSATSRRAVVEASCEGIAKILSSAPTPMRYNSEAQTPTKQQQQQNQANEQQHSKKPKRSEDGATPISVHDAVGTVDAARTQKPIRTAVPRPPQRMAFEDVDEATRIASLRKTLTRPSSATVRFEGKGSQHWVNGVLRDTAFGGVACGNPRVGKSDAMYDLAQGTAATTLCSPRAVMGSSPRFPGDKPCAPPRPGVQRPASADVRRPQPPHQPL